MAMDWYLPLRNHKSLGSLRERPGGLGGLAQARRDHLGQFFTPDALAAFLWRIAAPVAQVAFDRDAGFARVALLDNSIGTGRLMQFADPDQHKILGCDVHEPAIEALGEALHDAGFDSDVVHGSMIEVHPRNVGIALINPPFSLSLDAPTVQPYSCTHWGRFGEHSATISHTYALHQALEAAEVVLAILPTTYLRDIVDHPSPEMEGRFRAALWLPSGLFQEEGTQVAVGVAVFGPISDKARFQQLTLTSLDAPLPDFHLWCTSTRHHAPPPLSPTAMRASEPSIPGEVTGDARVRVVKDGRKLGLRFFCAATEAKVRNALLVAPVEPDSEHRYPKGIVFRGQGRFDLQLYLAQPDPLKAFDELLTRIRAAGGDPQPDPAIAHYLRRAARTTKRMTTPFAHVVMNPMPAQQDGRCRATVRRNRMLDPSTWGSPLLRAGSEVDIEVLEGGYQVHHHGQAVTINEQTLKADFELHAAPVASGWVQVHDGRAAAFPHLAKAIQTSLERCGAMDVASWDYQQADLIELRMAPSGILAFRMGCGKTRMALALCLAGGDHNAIVVESQLMPELLREIHDLNLDPSLWQVITCAEQCRTLRKINLLTYNRLKAEIAPGSGRRIIARLLRRRFNTVVADEAHLLRNLDTQQTQALWQLSSKRRYAMTGTPMANQVQDLLPLAQWAHGDGTVAQPYGRHHPYLEQRLLTSMTMAMRGVDQFFEDYVVTEWVTAEWSDGMTKGAKRQVPKINKLPKLRAWAASLIKRRHETEPMVAAHFSVPEYTSRLVTVPWDPEHLAHYLQVADEFAEWFSRAWKQAHASQTNVNLITLLARIGAVQRACNFPQHLGKGNAGIRPYLPLTSKQRAVIARTKELAGAGHKIIVYADSPKQCERFALELGKAGVEAIAFHGDMPIKHRTRLLDERFRFGPAPVLCASLKVTQNGLNLWQADRVLMACRSWSQTQEAQAIARVLRPQQTRPVEVEYFELEGSIDAYMRQHVAFKGDSAGAAIDCLEPKLEGEEFLHLDAILNQFVEQLAKRAGIDAWEYRREIRAA